MQIMKKFEDFQVNESAASDLVADLKAAIKKSGIKSRDAITALVLTAMGEAESIDATKVVKELDKVKIAVAGL